MHMTQMTRVGSLRLARRIVIDPNGCIEDERSIANRLERESKRDQEKEDQDLESKQHKQDATLPVRNDRHEASCT